MIAMPRGTRARWQSATAGVSTYAVMIAKRNGSSTSCVTTTIAVAAAPLAARNTPLPRVQPEPLAGMGLSVIIAKSARPDPPEAGRSRRGLLRGLAAAGDRVQLVAELLFEEVAERRAAARAGLALHDLE